jgi:[acyl-carrier-protein] S-malonyltransferase
MAVAFVFPGQGSQDVGMGRALADRYPTARAVFEEVDAALGQKLSSVMFDGPKDQVTLTENAQPALMAVSVAVMRVLERDLGLDVARTARFVAGHSLGEYSALVAAGAIGLADAARLLKLRGQAMQRAVPVGEGAMVALLGVGAEMGARIAAAAAGGDVCEVANDNEPTQVVLSGHKRAIDRVPEAGKTFGLRRAIPLPVSAPFHSALMQPAADEMAIALRKIEIRQPAIPLIANVLAAPILDPAEIRRRLVEQVTGTVRWRECVETMGARGVDTFIELGQGKVLAGLVKRTLKDRTAVSIGSPDEIEANRGLLGL